MTIVDSTFSIPHGTYVITGATGFIGSLLTRFLINSQEYRSGCIELIGLIRNVQKASQIYQNYDCSHLKFITSDLLDLNADQLRNRFGIEQIDYIFHCAANTRSKDMITYPIETANGIVIGTNHMLDIAKQYSVTSMVYLSSMEVYGTVTNCSNRIEESTLGELDILSARSCYPLGKRMAENLCYCYYKQHNVPVKIARLAQTFGPGVLPDENRIFAQFARCAMQGKDIVLHTKGDSVGNYVDSIDAVRGLFLLLTDGQNGEAYNIVNEENTMTILEMAQLVATKIAKDKIHVCFDIPVNNEYGYAAKTELRLSSKKIKKLGWVPQFGMVEMYHRIISQTPLTF